jgi:hypothetical protein
MSGWRDRKHSVRYCSRSLRTLRRSIGPLHHPVPARIVGGQWLGHSADLDRGMKSFPQGREDIAQVVEEVLSDVLQGVNHGRKTT